MTARRTKSSGKAATTGAARAGETVIKRAAARERVAPPEEITKIAAWANEGGAGGEVKK